jgi:hypothetical protein
VPEAGDVRSGPWLGASALPMPLSGEERLARLAGEGNDRACGVLFERYHQPLYRYCRSLVRSDVDAQDALQSTFAAALGALQRGQRDAPLRPWLFRIAHNESISLLRRRPSCPKPPSRGCRPRSTRPRIGPVWPRWSRT